MKKARKIFSFGLLSSVLLLSGCGVPPSESCSCSCPVSNEEKSSATVENSATVESVASSSSQQESSSSSEEITSSETSSSEEESISLDTVVNVTKIKRGFIISTQEAEEVVDYSKNSSLVSMSAAGVYYLVYDFDYYSRKETSGDLVLTAAFQFDMITILSALSLEPESEKEATPIPFIDSATNRMHNRIVQTFSIPKEADVTKHQRVVFRITPTAVGDSSMRMHFIVDDPNVRVVGDGAEGCTVPMVVQEYKIETPVPVYDTNLHWPHVKGANYYKVKLNGNYIKDSDGSDLRVNVDERLSVGSDVVFEKLALYGYGDNLPVVIEAYGLKAGVTQSDPSTPIYVNL